VAHVEPFRALRYAVPPAPDLTPLVAPPYDVIGPDDRRRLAAHPANIVHVDLPESERGGDPYREAGERLARWLREGVLARDATDAMYVAEHEFAAPDGSLHRRRGFFARLRLEPYARGIVIPHERTHEGPRVDRTRLLAATGVNLSPIFLLHPDPGARVLSLTGAAAAAPPSAWARLGDGEQVRLWRVDDPSAVEGLSQGLRDQWVLIADGHHRYESALAHEATKRAAGGEGKAGHVLAYLCSLEDPGLVVLPIHRVVRPLAGFEAARVRRALEADFELKPIADPAGLAGAVASGGGRPGVFGLLFGGETGAWVARSRHGGEAEPPGLADLPAPLRNLDVVVLERLVFERALGLAADRRARGDLFEYVKDAGRLIERARTASLGVLLNPTRLEQVAAIARLGHVLPQKSTYFHPKVPTGLVIDPLTESPGGAP
jgi:uncharacterized protein (DUF1015 family)